MSCKLPPSVFLKKKVKYGSFVRYSVVTVTYCNDTKSNKGSGLKSGSVIEKGNHGYFVYYESIKRELNKRLIFDSRCDVRLKPCESSTFRVILSPVVLRMLPHLLLNCEENAAHL